MRAKTQQFKNFKHRKETNGSRSDEKIGITFIWSAGGCILSNVDSTFLVSYSFASSKFIAIVRRSSVEVKKAYHHEALSKKIGRREERQSVSVASGREL
ncbi:hypothetical protein E2562_023045 [Oryza meyeriana var. granulata]|uniref:Uncharacterized protein n=1 Tax=Oryza meyeriana var. granulata TaxID=110450 RepID=A0A6G1EYH5_9ORYZ|nr:hypothetical protein E2562_023045 [Oryza meyeriana var. granulata]